MQYINLFNFPSMVIVSSSIIAGFIVGGTNIRKALPSAGAICIPLGVVGTLIGCIQLLQNMDDPSALGPAVAGSLVPFLYGLFLFPILFSISSLFKISHTEKKDTSVEYFGNARSLVASVFLLGLLFVAIIWRSSFVTLINFPSLLIVGLTLFLPTLTTAGGNNNGNSLMVSKLLAARNYSILSAVIGIIIACIGTLNELDDPRFIGPSLAIGLLTSFYSGLILIGSTLGYCSLTGRPPPKHYLYTSAFALVTVIFMIFYFALLTTLF